MPDNQFSRRNRVDLMVPAESAIREAALAVEKLPDDPLLTEALVMLKEAQSKVSDYIDSLPGRYKK